MLNPRSSVMAQTIELATVVSSLTVVFSVSAALGFRRRFPGSGVLFYFAVASLVMPSLLVGFGIGLGFQFLGWQTSLFTSALGAQLTWTLPFGLFAIDHREFQRADIDAPGCRCGQQVVVVVQQKRGINTDAVIVEEADDQEQPCRQHEQHQQDQRHRPNLQPGHNPQRQAGPSFPARGKRGRPVI
jgi:hypothetical protein